MQLYHLKHSTLKAIHTNPRRYALYLDLYTGTALFRNRVLTIKDSPLCFSIAHKQKHRDNHPCEVNLNRFTLSLSHLSAPSEGDPRNCTSKGDNFFSSSQNYLREVLSESIRPQPTALRNPLTFVYIKISTSRDSCYEELARRDWWIGGRRFSEEFRPTTRRP
jgi:hypothetical protein